MVIVILAAIVVFFFVTERVRPGIALPKVRGWWGRIVWINLAQAALVVLAGFTWDKWMQGFSLLQLTQWIGVWPSAIVAYVVSTFVYYWWHRYRHESEFFWRMCHQLHHSASRIEVFTSFYKHPLEMFINAVISSVLVYSLMGCDVRAGAIYTILTGVAEYFYHWNMRTPRWIGWLLQRPESHRVHHQRNRHTGNYADLPVWDMLFGTFHNPRTNPTRCGFAEEKELAVKDMLLFRDVHAPLALAPTCMGCSKRSACMMQRMHDVEEKCAVNQ